MGSGMPGQGDPADCTRTSDLTHLKTEVALNNTHPLSLPFPPPHPVPLPPSSPNYLPSLLTL